MATDLNIIVGVKSGDALRQLGNVRKQVDNVGAATRRTSGALRSHAKQYNSTAVATNKWAKGALQQAGYQVGDFAVQIAGGTNALQAFGQQGSQLLGIFGPVGAVLGAGVAIASAVGVAFTKLAGGAKEAKDAMEELKDKSAQTNLEIQALLRGINSTDIVKAEEEIKQLKQEQAKINDQIHKQEDRLLKAKDDGNKREEEAATKRITSFNRAILRLQDQIDLQKEYIKGINDSIEGNDKLSRLEKLMKTMVTARTEAAKKRVELMNAEDIVMAQVINKSQLVLEFEKARAKDRSAYLNRFLSEEDAIMSQAVVKSQAMLDLEKKRADIKEGMLLTSLKLRFSDEEALMAMPVTIDQTAFNKTKNMLEDAKKSVADFKVGASEITPELQRIKDVSEMVGTSFENAFMSMIKGTASAKDAFRALASDIISELYRVFVVKQITGFITGAVAGAFAPGSAAGTGGSVAPPVAPRAMGGPVRAGRPYLVGERGPELMVPSSNGAIIPNNQMGGGVVVQQTFNFAANGDESVKQIIAQQAPKIAKMTKQSIMESRRRGGQMKAVFG
jgi:hypothetical protein